MRELLFRCGTCWGGALWKGKGIVKCKDSASKVASDHRKRSGKVPKSHIDSCHDVNIKSIARSGFVQKVDIWASMKR